MNFSLIIVNTYKELLENIQRFNEEINSQIIPLEKLRDFYVYYYDTRTRMFGPSKYIKYKDMDYTMYKYFDNNGQYDNNLNKYFHGKVADIEKYNWFVQANSERSEELKEQIIDNYQINGYNFKLKSNTRIYINK